MASVDDYIGACDTGLVGGLSRQLIAEMNLVIPNVLVNFEDLPNVEITGPQVNPFMQSAAKEALRRAIRANGNRTMIVNSAYRTIAQQYLLYKAYRRGECGITLAASPGNSNHEDGRALDIANYEEWIDAMEANNWQWFGAGDEVHFTYVGPGTRDDVSDVCIKAFQRLWSKYNPRDRITDDGVFGDQTGARLGRSPAEGFGGVRVLRLRTPNLSGDDVRKVQQALVNSGFIPADKVDGLYGPGTTEAVKKFQEKKGLAADGVVGVQTMRALGLPV
jgi:hypothetical protein